MALHHVYLFEGWRFQAPAEEQPVSMVQGLSVQQDHARAAAACAGSGHAIRLAPMHFCNWVWELVPGCDACAYMLIDIGLPGKSCSVK